MTRKGREFNEIYDLTAMRVIVDSVKDCYGAVGVIHSLWKPLPGRFKDMIAMPKFNMYQALHTTVIGPEGRPLEIQIRTSDMHETAEYGVAAHWRYKEGGEGQAAAGIDPTDVKLKWLKSLLDWQGDEDDPREFTEQLRGELIEDEVYVFTPKGEVKSLAAGATPLDFAYEIHTDVGHRCVGAKVNGKIVPLHYELALGRHRRDPHRQARARPVARLAGARQDHPRAQQDPRVVQGRVARRLRAHRPRAAAGAPRPRPACRPRSITGSPLLADVIREMGFRKADDFYIALGGAKISPKVVVNKVLQRLKQGESAEAEVSAADDLLKPTVRRKPEAQSSKFGIRVEGVDDVPLRLAKCCRPVSGDPIVGYVSLGRGITIHRDDCPNAVALRKDPERFVPVSWDGDNETSFKVEIQVDAWDRHRLLEDLSRTFAEGGINIVEAYCSVQHPMVKNRFVIEVADTQALKSAINRLRSIDAVFDAYRVIPRRLSPVAQPTTRSAPGVDARAAATVSSPTWSPSTWSGTGRSSTERTRLADARRTRRRRGGWRSGPRPTARGRRRSGCRRARARRARRRRGRRSRARRPRRGRSGGA